MSFRAIAKFGLLLVVIGFFMPIACDLNGFDLADFFMDNDQALNGILTYVMFAAALAGVIFGVLLLLKKGPGATIDWIVIITCVASGLVVYLSALNDRKIELQNGAYLILVGWIVTLAFQIMSIVKKER